MGNDLFAEASSVERILGPEKNAYDKYDQLLDAAVRHGKGKLILIALGMTATVLAYDLAQKGYRAIDIGHIDVEYEWLLQGATEKVAIDGKYVNEVAEGTNVSEYIDPIYESQIIEVIV